MGVMQIDDQEGLFEKSKSQECYILRRYKVKIL